MKKEAVFHLIWTKRSCPLSGLMEADFYLKLNKEKRYFVNYDISPLDTKTNALNVCPSSPAEALKMGEAGEVGRFHEVLRELVQPHMKRL